MSAVNVAGPGFRQNRQWGQIKLTKVTDETEIQNNLFKPSGIRAILPKPHKTVIPSGVLVNVFCNFFVP